jgi:hypothetical protein
LEEGAGARLKEATTGLGPNGESLTGTHATTAADALRHREHALHEPWCRGLPHRHCCDPLGARRYERSQALQVWEHDLRLARWSRVQRRPADNGAARPMWLALRQALVCGEVSIREWNIPQDTKFGLRIEIHAPSTGPRSAVAASEPLVDGALSALHAGAGSGRATVSRQVAVGVCCVGLFSPSEVAWSSASG